MFKSGITDLVEAQISPDNFKTWDCLTKARNWGVPHLPLHHCHHFLHCFHFSLIDTVPLWPQQLHLHLAFKLTSSSLPLQPHKSSHQSSWEGNTAYLKQFLIVADVNEIHAATTTHTLCRMFSFSSLLFFMAVTASCTRTSLCFAFSKCIIPWDATGRCNLGGKIPVSHSWWTLCLLGVFDICAQKSGTFLLAAPILASTSATVQHGRCHACIQITTILTRKTANISLTPGFFKLSNYWYVQFFSDIGNTRQYC